jgi:amino acid transporter
VTEENRGARFRGLALGLAVLGIVVIVAAVLVVEHGSALLTVAALAAIVVLALPLAAYFLFRQDPRSRGGPES